MKMLVILLIVVLLQMTVDSSAFEPLQVVIEINGYKIPAIVDTGAEISVMSTSCAERCCLTSSIDVQHAGKAIGVGNCEIVGGIEALGLRIGPLSFQNKVSILRTAHQRYDFIIGLDILRRFNCDILLRQNILKMNVKGNEIRVPMLSFDAKMNNPFDDEMSSSSAQENEVFTKEDAAELPKMRSAKTDGRSRRFVQPRGGYYSQPSAKRESIFDNFDDDDCDDDEGDYHSKSTSYPYGDDDDEDDPDYLYNGNSVSMEGV